MNKRLLGFFYCPPYNVHKIFICANPINNCNWNNLLLYELAKKEIGRKSQ